MPDDFFIYIFFLGIRFLVQGIYATRVIHVFDVYRSRLVIVCVSRHCTAELEKFPEEKKQKNLCLRSCRKRRLYQGMCKYTGDVND
jgi:hypothetical protein